MSDDKTTPKRPARADETPRTTETTPTEAVEAILDSKRKYDEATEEYLGVTPVADADNPFTRPATNAPKSAQAKPKINLAGKWRVREGYEVAHGSRNTTDALTVGDHSLAKAGDVVELNHEDALSLIRLTAGQKDPKTGRSRGPAIENEEMYLARRKAEEMSRQLTEQLAAAGIPVLTE